jgi:hypothetical protein
MAKREQPRVSHCAVLISSGSLAIFAAIRLASSRSNNLAADLRPAHPRNRHTRAAARCDRGRRSRRIVPRRTKGEGSGESERLKRSPHSERDPQQSRRPIRLTDGFALSPMCRGDHHGNVGCRTNTGAILLSDCRQAYALAGS